MSNKIKNPNEKNNGFLWAILAVLLIAAVIIGYIFINGKNAKSEKIVEGFEKQDVNISMTYANNAVTMKSPNAAADTPRVDLYEDFSCPHCGDLAIATDGAMLKAIEEGKLIVDVRSLSFLDQGNADGHSHKAGHAAMVVAQNDSPSAYWNYRKLLMEKQKEIYAKWSMEEFAKAAKQVGASDETAKKISELKDHSEYATPSKQNEEKLQNDTGKVSSPRIVKNGKDIDDLKNWVAVATQK